MTHTNQHHERDLFVLELLRTTDVVLISHVEALLSGEGIACLVLDEHMSVLEGSIGALIPRRMMVAEELSYAALRALRDAQLEHVLSDAAVKALKTLGD